MCKKHGRGRGSDQDPFQLVIRSWRAGEVGAVSCVLCLGLAIDACLLALHTWTVYYYGGGGGGHREREVESVG